MPFGTGAGPAVWCHSLLPDYHAFSGRGGYTFPLHDRRPAVNALNVAPELLNGLSAVYPEEVSGQDVFDAMLCLLSAESYTRRFAGDLEDTFPHVVFPLSHDVFREAVRIGRRIRAVETFEPPMREAPFFRLETEPVGRVGDVDLIGGAIVLCENGTGRLTGMPQAVWHFSVSGYRVLPRWLEARKGLPADFAFVRELRDICERIAELIELFGQADRVLDASLGESLSREALHLPARGHEGRH